MVRILPGDFGGTAVQTNIPTMNVLLLTLTSTTRQGGGIRGVIWHGLTSVNTKTLVSDSRFLTRLDKISFERYWIGLFIFG